MNNKNWQHNKSIKFLEFNLKKNLITQMNKKLALLRRKNDVTHELQLKLHDLMNKKWL